MPDAEKTPEQKPTETTPQASAATPVAEPNAWKFGFTPQAETWNGRFAMLGFIIAVLIEFFTSQGVLHALGVIKDVTDVAP